MRLLAPADSLVNRSLNSVLAVSIKTIAKCGGFKYVSKVTHTFVYLTIFHTVHSGYCYAFGRVQQPLKYQCLYLCSVDYNTFKPVTFSSYLFQELWVHGTIHKMVHNVYKPLSHMIQTDSLSDIWHIHSISLAAFVTCVGVCILSIKYRYGVRIHFVNNESKQDSNYGDVQWLMHTYTKQMYMIRYRGYL